MALTPFSKKYPNEFLSRTEDNFDILLDKLSLFYEQTRFDIGDGLRSRRKLDNRFNDDQETKNLKMNQKGITTEEVSLEVNGMLKGCLRTHDPTTAFNLYPTPLLDVVASATLLNLYTVNSCWDFLSGKLCLYEKKIVRMLGQLIDWPLAEGFVVSGGKQALLYAIKSGINRANPVNH